LALDGEVAVEERLGDIGQSDGIEAGHTFEDELLGDVAEEDVHGASGGEIGDACKELLGGDFLLLVETFELLGGMLDAE
jgi:hypothetical protein